MSALAHRASSRPYRLWLSVGWLAGALLLVLPGVTSAGSKHCRDLTFNGAAGAASGLLQSLMARAADDADGVHIADRSPGLLLGGIAVTIAYVLVVDVIGFFVATALYLAAFMRVGRYRRYGVIALASVTGSLAFVVVFMRIVYVSLPPGVGPFRDLSFGLLALLGVK